MYAGTIKIVAFKPERHAFLANGDLTGIKLLRAPIELPPSIARQITIIPNMSFKDRSLAFSTMVEKL